MSYCEESLVSSFYDVTFAYPMVSVCDLPLSETGNYLKKYGDYMVGFCSEWGRRNHFATVWYCDQNSNALKTIASMLREKIGEFGDKVSKDEAYKKIVYLLSYIKQYEGPLKRRNYKKYRFYDEREQRFVPNPDDLINAGEYPLLWDYDKYKIAHHNSSLLPKRFNIPFEWGDIKYIIVEKESEKEEFRNLVEAESGQKDLNISYFTNKEVKEDIIGLNHDVPEIAKVK